MSIFKRLKELIYPSAGAGAHSGNGTAWVRPAFRDAAAEIERRGGMQETEIASISLRWRARQVTQAELLVQRRLPNGTFSPDPEHELLKLLISPNEDHTLRQLLFVTDLSLGLHGNAYWIKERSSTGSGAVVALKWVPSRMMVPFWDAEGKEFISGYAYTVNGQTYLFYKEDVLHFRDGIDDRSPRFGHSPLAPFLASVAADISMTEYEDAIMRNMGIPGAVFIPKPESALAIGSEQANNIKKRFKETTSGASRGEALVIDYPAEVIFPNVTPSNMSIETMRRSPEIRIPAALGLNAVAVGLDMTQTGLNSSKKEFIRQAWDYGVTPIHDLICDVLQKDLVPEFDDPASVRCYFTYDDVPFLREDESDLHSRWRLNWKADGITLDEFRAGIRLPPDTSGRGNLYYNEFVGLENGDNNHRYKESEEEE